jgi:hypothetical protein
MAACAGGRQPSAGKGPSHEQRRQRGRSRAPGRAGRRARQGGDPAPGRSTSSGSGRAAVARYCAGMGLLWFAVTLRLAGQGLGWAVPAYLALAFVCLVLAVIDAATRLLPNRSTYPAFPVVAGLLLAASLGLGELGRLGRGLLAAASVGGLFLLLALPSPHGMGWAMASWPRPWAWRSAGGRGGRWRWGWWPASCSPACPGWAACWHLACRARRGCRRPLAGCRGAAGRPRGRRGRRLVPGRLARCQVSGVSSSGR